jgi:D-3-phosphoglycerate dehydrogenase / 2-oxoglutarate reductase
MPKVLIADSMSPRAERILKERGIEVTVKTGLKPEALAAEIGGYDGLAVRSATKVTKDIVAAARALKVIGRAGIGVDNVDVEAATRAGILVMNTPFGNSITTAEHAIALMFALARQIPAADRSTQAGKWEKNRFMGVEITGKTLGIVGCGNIGTIVARKARGLDMKVVAYDPFLSPQRAHELGIEKVELDELLKRADFITLHTPLTEATRNIIGRDAIQRMKTGVRIVNCARGGLVDEAALREALDSGKVAGAALDVFETEPAKSNVLFGSDKLVATPHLGASTEEAQENVALQVAEQIADYLVNGTVTNPINMPAVSAEDAPRLRPYFALARQLGGFIGQISDSAIKAVHIEYLGQAADLNTKPLTAALLHGLLSPTLEIVNLINAPTIARQRDIAVTEEKVSRSTDYQTMIRVTVTKEKRVRRVAGTLIGGDKPRLVEVDDIGLEAELAGHMILVANNDRPGLIGNLGRALGDAGINIATLHLGRNRPGGDALALAATDQAVPEPVLMYICTLPNVTQVKLLKF